MLLKVAIPTDRRPVTPIYLLHEFTLEDRFIDCGSGPELAPINTNHTHANGTSSSPSPDFFLNMSPVED